MRSKFLKFVVSSVAFATFVTATDAAPAARAKRAKRPAEAPVVQPAADTAKIAAETAAQPAADSVAVPAGQPVADSAKVAADTAAVDSAKVAVPAQPAADSAKVAVPADTAVQSTAVPMGTVAAVQVDSAATATAPADSAVASVAAPATADSAQVTAAAVSDTAAVQADSVAAAANTAQVTVADSTQLAADSAAVQMVQPVATQADSAQVTAAAVADTTAVQADSSSVQQFAADTAAVSQKDSVLAASVADSAATAQVDSAATEDTADSAAPVVYTEIAGSINDFLTAANSPYLATANLVVNENEALVIDAGVEILFKPGTGLDIQGGAFAAVGQEASPIVFRGESGKWKGITLTGDTRASFNNVQILDAETAIALENTGADIRNATIKNANIGVSVRKAGVELQNTSFQQCTGIAVIAGEGSTVAMNNSEISGGKAGFLAEKKSRSNLTNVSILKNDFGIVDKGENSFDVLNLKVQENDIGIAATEIPRQSMADAASNNRVNSTAGAMDIAMALPSAPENSYAQKFQESEVTSAAAVTIEPQKRWSLTGNVGTEVGYHFVRTLHNSTGESYAIGNDTIQPGERYNNYFQVPGLFSGYNTYLKLESPEGRTLEFSAEVGSDHWNEWNVHKVNLTYTDALRKISLGDTYLNAGEIYLNGINLFGASYTVDHLKEPGERPVFETSIFAGETNRPLIVGERNPDIYKDYIEDGEGEPQEVVAGGMITWNMHRRFNGTLGFIASEDYKKDPFFRDGMGSSKNTIDPEISSRTFFAEGNWLFWPGNVELNGQVAFGAADTTDVLAQRAVNGVFSRAGVSANNFALIRKIMKDENMISTLSRSQLEEIFGDNNTMTLSEMRNQLHALVKEAKSAEADYEKKEDDQGKISDWDGNNIAALATLRWGIGNTTISAYYKYIGSKFYSAGSPDQLSNSRELGASIDQRIQKFWRMNLSYDLNVENASIGDEANIFGFSEGTSAGLFGDPSSSWKKEHDQDDLRALYIHNAAFKNSFTLGNIDLGLKYRLNYRTRHRPTRLHADFDVESGVFSDDWFKPAKGAKTYMVAGETDTVMVDSARFMEYYDMAKYDYLASGFEEKLMKHTIEAEVGIKFYKNLLKIGGMWIFRNDLSEFENDSLLKHFDFSDRTYGHLGYYFHGADYFEQRYPVSLTSDFDRVHNQLAFTPRYKIYNRDNMKEFEWTLDESLEVEVVKDFIDIALNGEFRQEFIRRHSDGTDEEEADINGSATVRVHYTKDLYSDYTFGANYSYRPDSRSEQFSDYFGVFTLNYAF